VARIRFEIAKGESTFLDPRNGFQETTHHFEVRLDPLTGRSGHFSHFGVIKPQKLPLSDYEKSEVKGFCPFCPDVRDKTTPKFVAGVLPEGRMIRGEATLVPNLFPYDVHSGVIIMANDHVVPLERLTAKRVSDTYSVGVGFLRKIWSLDPSLPYHLITWNYMPPSGGGLVHPHQQCSATQYPGNQYMDELSSSKRFHEAYGANYWQEYVAEEKERALRYIGSIGSSHWLSSFVSLGVLGELVCVYPELFTVDDFGAEQVAELSDGLQRVFAYYRDNGIYSFNASLFFGPAGQNSFSCHFRIAPRTFLNMRDFAADMSFHQTLLAEPVSVVMPEQLCADVKHYFMT